MAVVRLTTDGEHTVLSYDVSAQVAGKLAQIGSRLVEMTAKKMADEFFTNFAHQMEPVALAEAPAPNEVIAHDVETSAHADSSSPGRPRWLVWGLIALLALAAAAWLATRS